MKVTRVAGWMGMVLGLLTLSPVGAQTVTVGPISGSARYRPPGQTQEVTLRDGMKLIGGAVETDLNASVFVSPGHGARFRLSADTRLVLGKDDIETGPNGQPIHHDVFALDRGKLTAAINPGAGFRYDVDTQGGRVSAVTPGICVLCLHGNGLHVYVARGAVALFPRQGAHHTDGLQLTERSSVAMLDDQGLLQILPLNKVASGTSNCLLSGASPQIVSEIERAPPNPANVPGNPPVSAIQ